MLELLSDNFTGLAPMANMATQWLGILTRPRSEQSDTPAPSEASFLRDLIASRFDPERVGVSEWMPPAVTDEAPSWMKSLLTSKESRYIHIQTHKHITSSYANL